jgi:hypothetical protein
MAANRSAGVVFFGIYATPTNPDARPSAPPGRREAKGRTARGLDFQLLIAYQAIQR